MTPVSLTLVDIALMVATGDASIARRPGVATPDKQQIVERALGKLCDEEVQVPEATFRLNRLIDLGLLQAFGDSFIVTPKGHNAIVAAKSRITRLNYDLINVI